MTTVLVCLITPESLRSACDMSLACTPMVASPMSPSISERGTSAATESMTITSIAPDRTNASAISNARGLVLKGQFVALHKSDEGTLVFGRCKESGASHYACSCDFVQPTKPVYRCSCPSRQFPCKHCLGLMFALIEGKKFSIAPAPEDIVAKREKEREGAIRAYQRLNTRAIERLRPGGILVAASCSAHVTAAEFFEMVREAARRGGRRDAVRGRGALWRRAGGAVSARW